MISLDIFADPVCPWCLIAKLQLDRALESRPGHQLAIAWQPFRLNPMIPKGGVDRIAHLKNRPGPDLTQEMSALTAQAAALGLVLNPARTEPNTTDAHRLIYWAGLEGAQTRVMDGLMRAHWQDARDIGDHATLVAISEMAGMTKGLAARLLATDADRDVIDAREAHARQRGVSVAPTFILGDLHVVTGAQPAELWQNV
ncbi:MAG: DsbA family oxidoreductase, partial [Paracoccus sp. (in: a-proteobacteria)]|nr:DsbA family oxidoreductase [Paracoccus sp. (in: a-proteobacteria)]